MPHAQVDVSAVPSMDSLLSQHVPVLKISKIGEGTYGEAYKYSKWVARLQAIVDCCIGYMFACRNDVMCSFVNLASGAHTNAHILPPQASFQGRAHRGITADQRIPAEACG